MSDHDPVSPEVETRLREIVRDEQQKDQIRAHAVAEELRITNAILSVLARNIENEYRRAAREEPPTSYSYNWSRFTADVRDALYVIEEDSQI